MHTMYVRRITEVLSYLEAAGLTVALGMIFSRFPILYYVHCPRLVGATGRWSIG